jgi:hypothetical protein
VARLLAWRSGRSPSSRPATGTRPGTSPGTVPSAPRPGEHPDRPFTGYKLAHPVLSADGTRAGFAGLTMGASQVYGAVAEASCVWNHRHVPPRRWCGCGFYCLHAVADAQALSCATENQAALLIEVAASGRYIRYERGLRYSRQRVRAITESRCGCGNPGTTLADAGSGLIGWRHLLPVCERCADGRRVLTLTEFTALLGGPGRVTVPDPPPPGSAVTAGSATGPVTEPGEPPFAVLAAEIALLHARLDDLQSRLDRG